MSTENRDANALARLYKQVSDNPIGGLLVEDLAASSRHGQATARVGIAPDGNPIIYSRDEATLKRVSEALQAGTAVHALRVRPLDVADFRVLTRDAAAALASTEPPALPPARASASAPLTVAAYVSGSDPATNAADVQWTTAQPFTLTIRKGRDHSEQFGPFERVTDAIAERDEHGEPGQTATIYERGKVAHYRGGKAAFRFGRTQWTRAE